MTDTDLESVKEALPADKSFWILDPVDGGIHLHQGFNFWSMSICLIEDGRPVFSMVYDANRSECFHARCGQGAYMNGRPIRLAGKTELPDAFLMTAPPGLPDADPEHARSTAVSIGKLMPRSLGIRMLGSVALMLAYVACGRMDGYWEYGKDYYDRVSGALLVEEAGGTVTSVTGTPFSMQNTGILAGNAAIYGAVKAILKA